MFRTSVLGSESESFVGSHKWASPVKLNGCQLRQGALRFCKSEMWLIVTLVFAQAKACGFKCGLKRLRSARARTAVVLRRAERVSA